MTITQIPFYSGNDNIVNEIRFNLGTGSEVEIPIRFDVSNLLLSSNSLIISVTAGTNKHASDLNILTEFYGVNSRYELRNSKIKNSINIKPETALLMENDDYSGINLSNNLGDLKSIKNPPILITSKPNEKVNLAIRAGGNAHVENYIVWITLEFKQIAIIDNQNYWYFTAPKSKLAYKNISFKAPSSKGLYEICSFMVPNPWDSINEHSNSELIIDSSQRFTLKVE